MVAFWLSGPKFLGGAGDLRMVPGHSMNAGPVVGIPWGGADTQTLPYAKEFVFVHVFVKS